MDWFWNVLGGTVGLALGLAISAAIAGALVLIWRALDLLLNDARRALERIAVEGEVVVEEYDQRTMRHRSFYYMPSPDRVRLARKGEAGPRPRLDAVKRNSAA